MPTYESRKVAEFDLLTELFNELETHHDDISMPPPLVRRCKDSTTMLRALCLNMLERCYAKPRKKAKNDMNMTKGTKAVKETTKKVAKKVMKAKKDKDAKQKVVLAMKTSARKVRRSRWDTC